MNLEEPHLPGLEPRRLVVAWPAVVDAFLDRYRGKTLKAYRGALRRWSAWCVAENIDPLEVGSVDAQRFVNELDALERAPRTISQARAAIAGAYKWATRHHVIGVNPWLDVMLPKIDKDAPRGSYSVEQINRLIDVAEASSSLDHAFVVLGVFNGLRLDEICGADVADLFEREGTRMLTVDRKGGKRRNIPLDAVTAAVVDGHVGRRARGPLLENPRARNTARRLAPRTAQRRVKELGDGAGLPRLKPHDLRHMFATHALRAGIPLADVQDAMDHEDPATTRLYDDDRHAVDRHPTWKLVEYFGRAMADNPSYPSSLADDERARAAGAADTTARALTEGATQHELCRDVDRATS